jgi:hypothetical protein
MTNTQRPSASMHSDKQGCVPDPDLPVRLVIIAVTCCGSMSFWVRLTRSRTVCGDGLILREGHHESMRKDQLYVI